jgi:hypothetical protein
MLPCWFRAFMPHHKGRFCQFDFGPYKNSRLYGKEAPPNYKLDNLKVPISLHYSDHDSLSSHTVSVPYIGLYFKKLSHNAYFSCVCMGANRSGGSTPGTGLFCIFLKKKKKKRWKNKRAYQILIQKKIKRLVFKWFFFPEYFRAISKNILKWLEFLCNLFDAPHSPENSFPALQKMLVLPCVWMTEIMIT